jgi:geranylgeranyl pyrophosphate synthase
MQLWQYYSFACAFIIVACGISIWMIQSQPDAPVSTIDSPNYDQLRTRVNNILARDLVHIDPSLREICEYAVADGRRVRAVIVLSVAPYGAAAEAAATAVEYVHAASLVVDDMMDGDTTRRGKATVAAKWGQETAQMASVHLTSAAFLELYRSVEMLRQSTKRADRLGVAMMGVMAETLKNLSVGQWKEEQRVDATDSIMRQKTGSLFEMAFLCGWLARGGAEATIPRVRAVAGQFGDLFQIVDDLGDIEQDDERGIKTNYAIQHGRERAHARVRELAQSVIAECRALKIDTSAISEIIDYLVEQSQQK